MERNQHCRSGVLSGSHSYVAGNSAENVSGSGDRVFERQKQFNDLRPVWEVSGSGDRVFERQKQFNDLRPVWESEIQISEQAILVAEDTTLIRREKIHRR